MERAIARTLKLPPQVWFMRNTEEWMHAPPAAVPSTVPNGDGSVEELPSPPPPEDQSDQAFKAEDFEDTSSTSPAPTAQSPQPGMDTAKS